MKVLFVSSEVSPFIKTGGLADVAGSLPGVLNQKGADTRVVLPLYKCIPEKYLEDMKYEGSIYINIGWRSQYCGIMSLKYNNVTYYFIDNKYYFNGDYPYDFIHLDVEKFIFFSKAVLSVLPTIGFKPDVIHCNDWQTAPIPVLLDTFYDNEFYRGIKTIMTIHNLKFQGRWGMDEIKDVFGLPDYYYTSDKLEYYKDVNLLKGGIVYANKITTVSESYANEIKTPDYGEGLNSVLQARSNDLVGIVNGISYEDFNPKTDKFISTQYDASDWRTNKKLNKTALQAELGLSVDRDKMMIGIVSRLSDQKGFDLIARAMDELADGAIQLVVLGTGESEYEEMFRHFALKYPDRIASCIYFSNEMSHKIYAACDAFLMPSLFEPCGLSQLISLKYGTLPIVRETGGLKDTITPYNEYTGEGNGFSFGPYCQSDMMNVLYYAIETYYNHNDQWGKIVDTAINCDFSWDVSADKYIKLYEDVTGIKITVPKQKKTTKK